MSDREAIDEMLDGGALTKWEYSFLISLADKLDRGIPLSERETEKLHELINAHT